MAATVSIVVRAINATKAVFQDVGTQAEALNKRMNKLASVFKGLFVASIAAKFVKSLLEASSYTDQLAKSSAKVKSAWKNVAEEIGDAFALIALSLEPVFTATAEAFSAIIEKIKLAAAYYGALFEGVDSDEALRIAEETLAKMEEEQAKRREAAKLEKEEQKRNEYLYELYGDIYKLQQKITEEKAKGEDAELSTLELLQKRVKELEVLKGKLNIDVNVSDDEEINEYENKKLDLQTELDIVEAEKEIQELKEKALEEWKDQEQKKLEATKDRIEKTTKAEIESLEKQADAFEKSAQEKERQAEDLLTRAAGEDERRYRLKKAGINIIGGPSERSMRSEAERLQKQAAEEMAKAEASRKAAEEAQISSEKHLASIDEKIEKLLALKE